MPPSFAGAWPEFPDRPNLVFIVVPVVIPLILAIGVALPFIAGRDTARTLSFARQMDRTLITTLHHWNANASSIWGAAHHQGPALPIRGSP